MARAIYEKRIFHNNQTNEDVKYEVYGIVAMVDGERMELSLKGLSPAEKIAFKMLMTGSDPSDIEISARKATGDEKPTVSHTSNNTEDDSLDFLDSLKD
jgi:hypothetical protein